jgi:hypothetical protein
MIRLHWPPFDDGGATCVMKNLGLKLANVLLVIASCTVGLVSWELAYRVFLKTQDATQFVVQSNSIWEFDPDLGYVYPAHAHTDWAMIRGGVPVLCGSFVAGLLGSPGKGVTAEQLIAGPRFIVLGASYTAMVHGGETWPDILSDKLEQQTAKTVPILNLARDGYGVLQMFDQAAEILRAGFRPTALIVAVARDNLPRGRTWRTTIIRGNSQEVFTSIKPSLEINPKTDVRTTLISPRATRSWCEASRASGKENDVSRDIVQTLLATKIQDERRGLKAPIRILGMTHCYLCGRVLYEDPLHGIAPIASHPDHTLNRFQDDPQFVSDIVGIRNSGIPIWLVYLPEYPELTNARRIMTPREQELFDSLTTEVDRVIDLTPHAPLGDSATALTMMPYDVHPSRLGLEYYANELLSRQKW